MRNLKRALSLALASVMLLGMMVVGAGAASYPDVDGEKNVEAISVLQAVGAMKGDENGNFNPDKKVTRNEMAAVVARLLYGAEAESDDYVSTHSFTDVPEWADKYVSACYAKKIVTGRDETTFDGDGAVTAQEAAVMMLRALGYESITDTGADWASRAVDEARKINLFKGVGASGSSTATLNRNDVAQLALNTLKSDMVTTSISISVDASSPNGFKNEYTYRAKTVTEGDGDNYAGDETDDPGKGTLQLLEDLYDRKLKLGANADGDEDDLLGRPAKTWTYDDEDVYTTVDSPKYSIIVNESGKTLAKWAEKANKKLTIAEGTTPTLNGIDELADETALNIGDVVEFYDVDKDEASTVIVTRYSVGKITEVRECDPDVKKEKDAIDDGAAYVVEIDMGLADDKTEFYDNKIAGFTGGDYVEGAYIVYVEGDDNDLIDSYIAKTTDGKVTATATDYIRVDGTKYTTALDLERNSEYTFVLDKKGNIIGAEETAAEDVALDEVWYVVAAYASKSTKYGKSTMTQTVQAVCMDGTAKEFALYTWEIALDESGNEVDTPAPNGGSEEGDTPVKDGKYLDVTAGDFIVLEENDDVKGLWDASLAYDDSDEENIDSKIGDDYKISDALSVSQGDKIKADGTRIGGTEEGDKNVRVNGDTKYVIVESEGDALKVTTVTGGIKYTVKSGDEFYAITEEVKGNDVALYVVVDVDKYESDSDSKDVYYVDSGADYETIKIKSTSYYVFEVYDLNGEAVEVTANKAPDGDGATGFVTVKKIEDKEGTDVYTFEAATALELSAAYKDEKGAVTGGTFDSIYGTELNLVAANYQDIEAADAKVIDLHDTKADGAYGKTIKNLEGLYTAKKAGDGWTITVDVYLDDGAKLIVVTDVTAAEGGDEGDDRTEVSEVAITVTAPVKEQAFGTATTATEGVAIDTQSWKKQGESSAATGSAEASSTYVLTVKLKIADASAETHKFADSVTVTCATGASVSAWDSETKTVEITFAATAG